MWEMAQKGHSKATGIQKVCEYLGADIDDCIAIGDSTNDLDMLKAVKTVWQWEIPWRAFFLTAVIRQQILRKMEFIMHWYILELSNVSGRLFFQGLDIRETFLEYIRSFFKLIAKSGSIFKATGISNFCNAVV